VIYNGSLLLLHLKIKEQWQVIGGIRATKFSLNSNFVDSTNISSGIWRELLVGSGLKHVDIAANGSFSNSKAEQNIRNLAFTGDIIEYKISFASGENLIGKFQITYYEREGNVNEEERYAIGLASSGEMKYILDE